MPDTRSLSLSLIFFNHPACFIIHTFQFPDLITKTRATDVFHSSDFNNQFAEIEYKDAESLKNKKADMYLITTISLIVIRNVLYVTVRSSNNK